MRKPVKTSEGMGYTICRHEEIVFNVGICGVRVRVCPADRVREGAEGDGEALPVRRQPSRGVDVERALRREERQDLHRPLHARRGRALLRVRPRDGDDAPHRGPHEAPRRARRGHQHERQDPRAHGRGQRRQRVLRLAQRGHRPRMHRPLQLQGRVLVPLLPEGRQGRGARQDQPPLRPARHGDGPEVHAPLRTRGGRPPLHARHRGQVHARPRQGGRLGHLPHDLRTTRATCTAPTPWRASGSTIRARTR